MQLRSHAQRLLTPVKGQLTFLLPQEEVEFNTIGNGGLNMFPHSDSILLGGTYERREWSLLSDPEDTHRIVNEQRALFEAIHDPWTSQPSCYTV